jgi:asparagine N-glycosylation enzyme membrane subunit Stt3
VTTPAGRSTTRERLLLAAFLGAALAARCWMPYGVVFGRPGEPRLLGTDAYFHLRHAHAAVGNFPRLDRQDQGTHYPQGTLNDAAGLFDLAIAATSRILHGADATRDEVAADAAWFPPALGVATVALLWALARRVAPHPAPLLTSLLFLLYPGESLGRTSLGFADHHAAESFLTVGAVLGAVRLLQRDRCDGGPPWWRPAVLSALPMTALAVTWRGAPLVLLLLAAGLVVERLAALGMPGGEEAGSAQANGRAARGGAPASGGSWGPWSLARPIVRYGLGLLLPLLAIRWLWPPLELGPPTAGLMLAGATALTVGGGLGLSLLEVAARRSGRPAAVAWTGLAAAVAGAALLLAGTGFGRQVWAWLAEPRTALVQEHLPVTAGLLLEQLGAVALLGLPGLALGAIQVGRRSLPSESLVPLGLGAGLLAVWCSTRDLGYAAPPFLALAAALPPLVVWRWVRAGRAGPWPEAAGLLRRLATVALLAALTAPLWPYAVTRTPWMGRGDVVQARVYPEPLFAAMDWLRDHTPPPEHPEGGSVRGRYGVLSSWPIGNLVAAYGERVPVWSRYPSPEISRWALAQGEEDGAAWLCPRCGPRDRVRYVVVDARDCGEWLLAAAAQLPEPVPLLVRSTARDAAPGLPAVVPGPAYDRSLVARLCADDGSGLAGYRLVYESPERSLTGVLVAPARPGEGRAWARLVTRPAPAVGADGRRGAAGAPLATPEGLVQGGRTHAAVKVFEVVPGARLIGAAPPGARVTASLWLEVRGSGRRWQYVGAATATAAATFELVVPYPSHAEPRRSSVRPSGPYRVIARDAAGVELQGEAVVSASEVRRGAAVPVGLRDAAAGGGRHAPLRLLALPSDAGGGEAEGGHLLAVAHQ